MIKLTLKSSDGSILYLKTIDGKHLEITASPKNKRLVDMNEFIKLEKIEIV